jgi:putative serine protease PepD
MKGMQMLRTRTAAVVAASALAAGVATGVAGYAAVSGDESTPTASAATQSPAVSSSSRTTVGAIYEQANPSVVEITVTSQTSSGSSDSPFPFGGAPEKQTQQAQGSGFVYDTEGHIVTNDHVVEGATSVKVTFANGATYKATVVGTDPSTDLAVIKVDAPSSVLHPLDLADSDHVAVGDGVVAIGSPFGLENTLTTGVVSALNRTIDGTNGYSIPGAIQTDAAINHGNSGGVLLNMQGDVIGVTSQIESESGGNVGIGFAIPSNTVRSVADQLVSGQKVAHAYLGVSLEDAASGGARIATVTSGSPAAHAGLKAGDVVTALDGHSIANAEELTAAVVSKQPGDTVKITVKRDGPTKKLTATLGTRPSSS